MTQSKKARVLREYGPFPEVGSVHGVTFDGTRAWFGTGSALLSLDPESGEIQQRLPVAADAGTAFDGTYLYQITGEVIHKLDATSGDILATIPAPGKGRDSGLTWAEGTLWVGQYQDRQIHNIDPHTGKILKTLESDRFVTGVTWVDGELWHATWENDESELRRVEPDTGEVLERLEMPSGSNVSGLECDGKETFFCGGGGSGKLRAVQRPARAARSKASDSR